jgi:hypothetical protein
MRILYIVTLSALILYPGIARGQHPGNGKKNILVFCALAPTTPVYKPILDGIRTELTTAFGDAYNLHTEYLETEVKEHL